MSKISLKELTQELKRCGLPLEHDDVDNINGVGVYHYHEWDHGYEAIYGYNGTRREFYADMRDSLAFLHDYIEYCNILDVIIAPCYRYSQFTHNAKKNYLYDEIYEFLKKHGIRRGSRTGVKLPIDGNWDVIEMVIEGSFRDISMLCLFFPSREVLLVPNHHFDLTFLSTHGELEKATVTELIKRHPNLRYFGNV